MMDFQLESSWSFDSVAAVDSGGRVWDGGG